MLDKLVQIPCCLLNLFGYNRDSAINHEYDMAVPFETLTETLTEPMMGVIPSQAQSQFGCKNIISTPLLPFKCDLYDRRSIGCIQERKKHTKCWEVSGKEKQVGSCDVALYKLFATRT